MHQTGLIIAKYNVIVGVIYKKLSIKSWVADSTTNDKKMIIK